MNYIVFQQKMRSFPVFSVREIEKQFPGFDTRRLVEWQEKGYIQKLRNCYYYFTDQTIDQQFLYYIANQLYRPSYVSLESALAHYGFIPEGVFETISCTTLKSQRFETPAGTGTFVYHHLKRAMFFGYCLVPWKEYHYALAEPEKAIIDYLYLHPEVKATEDVEARRWNIFSIKEQIDTKKLAVYEKYIRSTVLSRRLNVLKEMLDVKS